MKNNLGQSDHNLIEDKNILKDKVKVEWIL